MIFTQALNLMCDSKKLTRKEWNNKDEYGLMQDDRLRIHTKGEYHDWILTYGDLLAEDWEEV
jgi:hypothetical protein